MLSPAPMRAPDPAADHDDDRDIPTGDVGKLWPNYYCRGWDPQRKMYCRFRAGTGTIHPGTGRCKLHGGRQRNDRRVAPGGAQRVRGSGRQARRSRPARPASLEELPTTYVGKLESNYYCRAWNVKRQKYCGSRAGFGTNHPGSGRCKLHGGLQQLARRSSST
jgi:hypothetical protein